MRRTRFQPLSASLLGALALTWLSCASGSFVQQTYRRGEISYRIGALSSTWQRTSTKGADLVFKRDGGGTIAASAACRSGEDAPLDVLTNHLLFGIERQKEHSREALTLDGRAALRTHLTGELDGVPLELALVVLKKDGCVYDLQLIAAAAQFAHCLADFDAFVQGFSTLRGQ